jgi:hypothetical protein
MKFVDGGVVGSCGPLDHSEVDEQFLDGLYYSAERAAWIEEHREALDLFELVQV